MLRAKSPAIVLLPLEIYVERRQAAGERCVISHFLRDDYFSRHWSPSLLASNGILGFSISRDKMSKHAVTAETVDPDGNEAVYTSCFSTALLMYAQSRA